MLDNYKLGDSIVDSSQLAAVSAQADAARQGREAVETLNTLLVRETGLSPPTRAPLTRRRPAQDYFDSDEKSLQVTKLSPEKLNFAVNAFSSAREREPRRVSRAFAPPAI